MSDDLRCYCCGARLESIFALVAMDKPSDRVFVMLPEHAETVDGAKNVVLVSRIAPTPRENNNG